VNEFFFNEFIDPIHFTPMHSPGPPARSG
jgi:hypothetical protein